jgi:CRP/FNR family cyclic AMP-dependent transcriptional regulator
MARRTESTPLSLLPALKSHLWFASCPEPFQLALIELSRLWHLRPGETLFSRGEQHDSLCCVVAGALKVGSTDPRDGSHRLSLYLEPYQWIGEISMIDGLPRGQDAVADMDTTVMVVSGVQLEEFLVQHPRYWRDIARLACGKLRMILTAADDNATLSIEERLARRLLFSATGFGQSTSLIIRKRVRLPQDYLARMLGVSRQTINKALRTLEREEVLALHYAEVEILDVAALVGRCGAIDPALMTQGMTAFWGERPGDAASA